MTTAARVSVMMFSFSWQAFHLSATVPSQVHDLGTKDHGLLSLLIVYFLMLVPRAESESRWDANIAFCS